MCKVLNVSRAAYYLWLNSEPCKRSKEAIAYSKSIRSIFNESKSTYGCSRIALELGKRGNKVSRQRVSKLMKAMKLRSVVKRKFRNTTDSKHKYPVAKNLLKRNFSPSGLAKAWVSDITYIRTEKGWLYLTTVIDLYDRQVIGWALSSTMYTKYTIIPAWRMAVARRPIVSELIFHSDRGVQYACEAFTNILRSNKLIKQSISRKGNCWDNAVAESFFKTLKVECVYRNNYPTREVAKLSVFEYIETWYNTRCIHTALGDMSPREFEMKHKKANLVA